MLLSVGPGDSELGLLFGQSFAKGVVSTAQTGAALGWGWRRVSWMKVLWDAHAVGQLKTFQIPVGAGVIAKDRNKFQK